MAEGKGQRLKYSQGLDHSMHNLVPPLSLKSVLLLYITAVLTLGTGEGLNCALVLDENSSTALTDVIAMPCDVV